MKKILLLAVVLAFIALFPVNSWAEPAGSDDAVGQTQTAASDSSDKDSAVQAEKAEDEEDEDDPGDFRVIVPKREQKNTTTIPAPPGVKETNERRHNTYMKISKRAKDRVNDERRAEQASEDAKMDAETGPPPEEPAQKPTGSKSGENKSQTPAEDEEPPR